MSIRATFFAQLWVCFAACTPPLTSAPSSDSLCPDTIRPVGHHSVQIIDGRTRWFYAPDTPVSIFRSGPGPDRATWRTKGTDSVWAAVETSTVPGGHRVVLRALPSDGELEYCDLRLALALTPEGRAWPRVREAGGDLGRLKSIVEHPEHELEAQAALLQIARAASKTAPEGDPSAYETYQVKRARRAERSGLISEAATAYSSAAWVARRRRAFGVAEQWLRRAQAQAQADVADDDLIRARVALQAGYLWRDTGRFRRAVEAYGDGRAASARHGDVALSAYLTLAQAGTYGLIGRYREALRLLDSVEHIFAKSPARRLDFEVDRTYTEALAIASGALPQRWPRIEQRMQAALALARRLARDDIASMLLANLAWTAERQGAHDRVAQYLDQHRTLGAGAYAEREIALLEARSLLPNAPAQALQALDALRATLDAESAGLATDLHWRVSFAQAQAFALQQRHADATKAFDVAITELESVSAYTDLRASRARFLEARTQLFDTAAAHALAQKDFGKAFVISERAKAQVLDALRLRDRIESLKPAMRARWLRARERYSRARDALADRTTARKTLPAAELPAFDASTEALEQEAKASWTALFTLLAQKRSNARLTSMADLQAKLLPNERLLAFVQVAGQNVRLDVTRHRVETAKDTSVSLRGVAHVYLVPGPHMPLEVLVGRWIPRLLPKASVSVLPLASLLVEASPSTAEGPALVVGDSLRDLPASRREAIWVAARLNVSAVTGRKATRRRVRDRLERASLFHFAGHGTLSSDDPWRSELLLTKGDALRLEDLLARPIAPRLAVLSGCDTGRSGWVGRRFRVGLPEALLLGGTRTVIAATREVDDQTTEAFVKAFYQAGGAEDPVGAYRTVLLEKMKVSEKDALSFAVWGLRR